MGTPIDCEHPLVEWGNDCDMCPVLFPPGKTPKFVYVAFTGITKCEGAEQEPPNDKLFKLTQSLVWPCSWQNPESAYCLVSLAYYEGYTYLLANLLTPPDVAFDTFETAPSCIVEGIPNALTCPPYHYQGGLAHVWWEPDDIPRELVCHYHFHPLEGNRFDRLILPENKQCIRIANKKDKTNCLFKINTLEFPP